MIFSSAVPRARGFRTSALAVFLSLTLGTVGCQAISPGTGGQGGKLPSKESVAFDETGTLELSPSELETLHVRTAPSTEVHVLLVGAALDASLDKGSVTTDQDGHATVTLKAPSMPTSFHVVARVSDPATGGTGSADLAVAVSDAGFGSVRVLPKYLGNRTVTTWQASVTVGVTCDAIHAQLPSDPVGALMASATAGGTPIVGSVPVGPKIAVVVRSGALMWGCVETTISTPSTTQDLTLNVTDTPMRLDSANLALSLDYAPPMQSYSQLLTKSKAQLIDTAFPATANLSTLVLDAMRENVPVALLPAFDQHRQTNTVDASVAQSFATAMVNPRAKLQGWANLVTPPPSSSQLTLHGLLLGTKNMPGNPTLMLDMFGPVAAADAGVPPSVPLTWMAQPGDSIVAGGKLTFSPTRLVGKLVEKQAILAMPSVTGVVDALSQELNCTEVGMQAGGFAGCDATCGHDLCVSGVKSIWLRGLSVEDDQGSVGIAISSSAAVDATAAPSTLTGTWVGSLSGLGTTCPMMGNATAVAVPTP